jgi:lysophospholipase L1-like esterase
VSRSLGTLFNLALAAISTVVVLGGAELAARRLGHYPPLYLTMSRQTCLRRSWLLGYQLIPSCTGTAGGTSFTTNGLGLRGPEVRDDGSIRILALGDSCTWGYRVREEESYPEILQRLLDRRAPGRYQLINAGVPRYTSYHGVLYLSEQGLALKPAIVLIGFQFNDQAKFGDIENRIARERLLLPVLRLEDWLVLHSRLYHWVRLKVQTGATPAQPPRVDREQYFSNLARMVRLSREHGARVALIDWNLVWSGYPLIEHSVAEQLKVPIVTYQRPRLDADVVHPTPAGNEVLARELLDALDDAGYLVADDAGEGR